MIEELAIVVGVENQSALLEVIRRKPCGLCGQTRGCGISLWGRIFGHRSNVFKVQNHIDAKIGDSVVVGVEENALMFGAVSLYGIPLAAILVGSVLASQFAPAHSNADLYATGGALSGLVLGLLWLKVNAQGRNLDARYRPVILRSADESVIGFKCERGE